MLSNQEVAEANRLVNDLTDSNSKTLGSAMYVLRLNFRCTLLFMLIVVSRV